MRTKMNSSNTEPVAASTRTCTWRWPPCDKWMQNNGNKLCASHNTRFIGGERPIDPTAVAAADTAATVHRTTTATTPADTTPTANTKRKKKKEKNTKKKKKKKVKKAHKGKSALTKRKKREDHL